MIFQYQDPFFIRLTVPVPALVVGLVISVFFPDDLRIAGYCFIILGIISLPSIFFTKKNLYVVNKDMVRRNDTLIFFKDIFEIERSTANESTYFVFHMSNGSEKVLEAPYLKGKVMWKAILYWANFYEIKIKK